MAQPVTAAEREQSHGSWELGNFATRSDQNSIETHFCAKNLESLLKGLDKWVRCSHNGKFAKNEMGRAWKDVGVGVGGGAALYRWYGHHHHHHTTTPPLLAISPSPACHCLGPPGQNLICSSVRCSLFVAGYIWWYWDHLSVCCQHLHRYPPMETTHQCSHLWKLSEINDWTVPNIASALNISVKWQKVKPE